MALCWPQPHLHRLKAYTKIFPFKWFVMLDLLNHTWKHTVESMHDKDKLKGLNTADGWPT